MAGSALARHDDKNEEGGTIVSGASTVVVNGRLVAQVGNHIEPHYPGGIPQLLALPTKATGTLSAITVRLPLVIVAVSCCIPPG